MNALNGVHMKNVLLSLSVFFSISAYADSVLICKNQNSEATYQLNITKSEAVLSPLIKDASTLSISEAKLDYQEGESSEEISLFGGKNDNGTTVVIEISRNLNSEKEILAAVYYTKEDPNLLNQFTVLSCQLK